MEDDKIIGRVRQWIDSVVVELNLCPFARRELANNRVRFTVTAAASEQQLLEELHVELELLNRDSSIETTLLVHPNVLRDFFEYNDFLGLADRLLVDTELEGVYQIASFHPDYRFSSTDSDDAENFTNRSPYPMLHLLREESVERAIAEYPDVDQVPQRNIELMNSLGRDKLAALLRACIDGVR